MDMNDTSFSNNYTMADKEFSDKVRSLLLNSNQEYTVMEISRKTKLTKTQVLLSINQLLRENIIACNVNSKDKKKYYTSIKN